MAYHKNRFFLWLATSTLLLTAASCVDSDDVGSSYATFTGETIKDFLDNNDDYSEFEAALSKAGALSLMSSYGKYTCFVPGNKAVDEYVARKGFASFEAFLDSAAAVEDMVYYHIIDGEANGTGTYATTTFSTGNIETKNMLGRFIYTTVTPDGTSWLINNDARITSANNNMVNGVVHVVDRVVEGNNEVLSNYLMTDSRFSLYAEALKATGLIDSLSPIEDDVYSQPDATTSPKYPARRLYGYTALLEPDSVLRLNGIESLDDMRRFAEDKYPGGRDLKDNDPEGSLWQFVAYHLVPYKMTSSQLCPTRDFTVTQTFEKPEWQTETFRDGKFTLDNFLFPMAKNSIINVQKFVWRDQVDQTPVFNDERNPYDPQYVNFLSECPDAVTIDITRSNIDCLNGEVHSLTGMLYPKDNIFHRRLRMDFCAFFPEMFNNSLLTSNHSIPRGYLKNFTWDDRDGITARYFIRYGTHSNYWGDVLMLNGRGNYEVVIGPVPSGSYEVRIGYHVRGSQYGMVQYYLDGEPCGIPLDQSLKASDSEIGWSQTWFYLNGGVEEEPIQSWTTGLETADDYYGYDNDKALHNRGYMKSPDAFTSTELANNNLSPVHAGTSRNDAWSVRRVLGMVTWPTTTTHVLRISNLMDKGFDLDFIEFMPRDLIENEDTH